MSSTKEYGICCKVGYLQLSNERKGIDNKKEYELSHL
jgi:hypothetical protein